MRRAAIVCGFPGVGKTTVANATKIAEDIESTPFHWKFFVDTVQENGERGEMNTIRVLKEPEEIDGWVSKYVDHINEVSQNTDVPFLLVSCHKAVREEMQMRGIRKVLDRIKAAPTISPDEVRGVGEWIAHGDCGVTECSVCGWNIEEYVEYNYCPSCGARMTRAEAEKAMEVNRE